MNGDRVTPLIPEPTSGGAREPWERQPGEGEREWATFKAYRDQPPPRAMSRIGHLGGIAIASGELSGWFRRWHWDERVAAYDVLSDRIIADSRRKFLEQATEEVTAEQMVALQSLRRLVTNELRKFVEASAAQDGVCLMKMADLKGLIEASIKMDRLVRGEATEKTEATVDLSGLSLDELRAWNERFSQSDPE